MALAKKDLWATVKDLLLEQYRRDNTANVSGTLPDDTVNRFQGLLKTLVDGLLQPLDDAALDLQGMADIGRANGGLLDALGKIAGLIREPGESDASFRSRIVEVLGSNDAGTPDRILKIAKTLSGDAFPQLLEEVAATYFVYTPNGMQMSRSQVKSVSPAGVLGLPGAAVKTGDGTLLADANGKLILMVADDDALADGEVLVTELDEPIMTENGDNLATE